MNSIQCRLCVSVVFSLYKHTYKRFIMQYSTEQMRKKAIQNQIYCVYKKVKQVFMQNMITVIGNIYIRQMENYYRWNQTVACVPHHNMSLVKAIINNVTVIIRKNEWKTEREAETPHNTHWKLKNRKLKQIHVSGSRLVTSYRFVALFTHKTYRFVYTICVLCVCLIVQRTNNMCNIVLFEEYVRSILLVYCQREMCVPTSVWWVSDNWWNETKNHEKRAILTHTCFRQIYFNFRLQHKHDRNFWVFFFVYNNECY